MKVISDYDYITNVINYDYDYIASESYDYNYDYDYLRSCNRLRVVASYTWLTCRTSPGLANRTRRRHFQKYKFFGSCWERTTSTACTPAWSRGTWCVYCVYSGMVTWYMMCVLPVFRHGRVVHDACTACTPAWSRGTWCMYCVYSGMVAWYMMRLPDSRASPRRGYCLYSAMVAWYMMHVLSVLRHGRVAHAMVVWYMMHVLRVLRYGRVVHDACTACIPAWLRGTWCVYLTHAHQLAGVGKHDPSEAFSKVQILQKLLGAHQVERFVFRPLFARPGAGIQCWCTEKRGWGHFRGLFILACVSLACVYVLRCVCVLLISAGSGSAIVYHTSVYCSSRRGREVHVASTGRLPSPHGCVVASYIWLTCRTSPGLANRTHRRRFQKYKFFGSCWERTTSTACTPAWSRGTWCVYCLYSAMVAWYMPWSRGTWCVYCLYSAMVAWYMPWSRGTWCVYCVYSGMVAWYMMRVLPVLRHGRVVHDACTACTPAWSCDTWCVYLTHAHQLAGVGKHGPSEAFSKVQNLQKLLGAHQVKRFVFQRVYNAGAHQKGEGVIFGACLFWRVYLWHVCVYCAVCVLLISAWSRADMGDYKVHVIDCDYDYLRISWLWLRLRLQDLFM